MNAKSRKTQIEYAGEEIVRAYQNLLFWRRQEDPTIDPMSLEIDVLEYGKSRIKNADSLKLGTVKRYIGEALAFEIARHVNRKQYLQEYELVTLNWLQAQKVS